MDIIVFLLIIAILIVLVSFKSDASSRMKYLEQKIDLLTQKINDLRNQERLVSKELKESTDKTKAAMTVPTAKPVHETEERIHREAIRQEDIKPEPVLFSHTSGKVLTERKVVVEAKPGFFERNPDLEKFIGENLANKIGIAILVVGIGFFVKYAIDKDWINEIGRVFIGILCGGILLGVAHRLRKTFVAFSSVLVGGGIAVLYFTIAIAFHEYHIFSQTAAFLLMTLITAFSVMLSLGYNRVELAVLAILGGFSSPFMVSTGEGNYIVLFTYMLILNSGMLVLAYYKKWRIVNVICYVFTMLIFGIWLSLRFDNQNSSIIRGSLVFATAFYLIFFLMNIINNLKERTTFKAVEILMLLSNTFLYYSAGMVILNNETGKDFQGLFTVLLALFNFVFAYVLYKNMRADRNLVFMLIGLVLTFISLAAPIQLEGNYITLFWAAEAVLLLWLSQKSGITLMKVASCIVLVLMTLSLMIDWKQIYLDVLSTDHLTVILNKGYITSIVATIALILIYHLNKKESETTFLPVKGWQMGIVIAIGIVLYISHLLELRHHLVYYIDSFATRTVIVGAYNMFFIMGLLLAERRMHIPEQMKQIFPFWGLIAIGAYLFYYHEIIIIARDEFLEGVSTSTGFIFHYLMVILLLICAVVSLKKFNTNRELTETMKQSHWWLFIFFFVFIASAELDHIVLWSAYTDVTSAEFILEENHKIGFPILWGIASFILIAAGLKRKIKIVRIISLALLLITLFKLFIIDLRNISEGGKIAAFISLGILLLVVSFMYQRLKKLLLEDLPQE